MSCSDFTFTGDKFGGVDGEDKFSIAPVQSDYTQNVYPPGDYFIEITGTVVGSTTSATTQAKLTLQDPCDPPSGLSVPAEKEPSDVEYTITAG